MLFSTFISIRFDSNGNYVLGTGKHGKNLDLGGWNWLSRT